MDKNFRQMFHCECDLSKLLPKLENLSGKLSELKLEITKTNRERQRSVWNLLESPAAVRK